MTSDTRPSTLARSMPFDLDVMAEALFQTRPERDECGSWDAEAAILAERYSSLSREMHGWTTARLLEEQVAPESESELRFAAGDR